MFSIFIQIAIPIAILILLFFTNKRVQIYFKRHCAEIIVNFIVVILSVFLGAYIALRNTVETNKSDEIKNYQSMLNSCINSNQEYMNIVSEIIDSLNSDSRNFAELDRLIKSIQQPILLEELLRKSELYSYASSD